MNNRRGLDWILERRSEGRSGNASAMAIFQETFAKNDSETLAKNDHLKKSLSGGSAWFRRGLRIWLMQGCKIRCRTLVRAKSSNFRRLFLGCIEADFCNQILIFQHFSRSTRFAILRTAQISKFQQKSRHNFVIFERWIIYSIQISLKTH